nr:MAG TPA: hypothetical protein [Caudoviricetes sp.]
MKITLDEKTCLKHKLTLQEALIAAAVSMGNYKSTFDNMINRHVLGIMGQSIDSKWKDTIKNLINSEDARFEALAIKVQECFPKQKMINPNGLTSPFYFRCNKGEIKNKLKKFIEVYGEVSDDDIVDATKRYVASYAPKGYRGMRLAKYFIIKDDRKLSADDEVHVEQLSDLATFLENKTEDTPSDIVDGDDWLMNSRN